MRELKFRAWDEKDKKYNYQPFIYDKECLAEWSMVDLNKALAIGGDASSDERNASSVIFEQYTGLKDKNGKEIYEGDIVSFKEYPYIVIFEYGCFMLENKTLPILASSYDFNSRAIYNEESSRRKLGVADELEVVGNIHENDELLEEVAKCLKHKPKDNEE